MSGTTSNDSDYRIELPCYGIVVLLNGDPTLHDHPSGEINTDLHDGETCPFCGQQLCNFDCDMSQGAHNDDEQGESDDEVRGRLQYHGGCDALESLILSHAIAGIDITSPAYIEGIESAVEALGNNT